MWQCKGTPNFFNKANVNKSSKYLFWHIFICFIVCLILPVVCGEKSVSSFSNYYTKFLKNGAERRTGYTPTFPATAPVSIPENVLADYSSYYPSFRQQIRIQKRKEEPASTDEHKDHSNEIKNENHGWGWGEHKKEPEKDDTLDEFTGYLGPFLFLVPFVLKLVPFAIPALPLSYILTRYEPGNVTEIITRVTEFATQLTDLIQQTTGG